MKNRKTYLKAFGVILVTVLIPSFIVAFSMSNVDFLEITEKAGVFCAKMLNGDSEKFKENDNEEIPVLQKVQALVQKVEPIPSSGSMWSIYNTEDEDELPIPNEQVEIPPQTQEINTALPYPTNLETKSGVIKKTFYGKYTGVQYINLPSGQVRNCTKVSNADLIKESELIPEFKIELKSEPQVLIMHTHTTESYEPYSRDFYDDSFSSRTTDHTKNVVAVGEQIKQELEAVGIGVIHDATIHDYPSYNGSYQRSAVTVEKILEQYPSIKVVLDVHRDAIQGSDGVRIAPVAEVNGKDAAQVMIISGCDDGTMDMPNYMQNFRLSAMLQTQLESDYAGITRPVLFDYRKYNQDLTTGSILLEMGTHGNSLDEAMYSGELVGKSLAQVLLKLQ